MSELLVHHCGPATSIQDRGRFGWHRHGITSSGAADQMALAAANALVGNPPGTEAIELVFMGISLEVRGSPARMALAGAPMRMRIDGRPIPDHVSFVLEPGCRLDIGTASVGVYACLAIEGGFAIPMALGSRSLHRRANLGGVNGKPLSAGDCIPLNTGTPRAIEEASMPPLRLDISRPLRTVPGPQSHFATTEGLATFLSADFRITSEVDRMACRLSGPSIELTGSFNIVSDGIVPGSVQIPGSGQPIVMLADRQTTGGYPKIATIITPDIRLLVQRRTGETVRFSSVSIEEAEDLARAATRELQALPQTVRYRRASDDELLAVNLAGHATSASDPTTWQP